MSATSIALVLLGLLFLQLAGGVWIGLSLLGVGMAAFVLFTDAPLAQILGTTYWGSSASWSLASLPLFIWMGEILFRTRLADDLFSGLAPWVERLPGRLLHTNVIGCGIFAAVSGSSAATAATVGRITVPELLKRGYPRDITLGSIAGAGTLGLLIPPSIVMIVYGVAAEVSIGRLFIAGVVPGIMLMAFFSGYIAVQAALRRKEFPAPGARTSLAHKIRALRYLGPITLLIVAVMATIYAGIATPTEAAAFGVVGALVISAATGSLSMSSMADSLKGTVRTTSMIALILVTAAVLSTSMAFLGIPRGLAEYIAGFGLSKYQLIAAICVLYIILGCFLDGISMIVLTTAVLLPLVQAANIDMVWFGIFVVLVVEMSCITPPVGFNLFVIQGLTGDGIGSVARAAFPFFLLMVTAVAIITAFPDVVLFLPRQMSQ